MEVKQWSKYVQVLCRQSVEEIAHINVMCRGWWGIGVSGGSLVLFMRPAAEEKKLFLWRELLVLMDRSLLPEGSRSKSLCL